MNSASFFLKRLVVVLAVLICLPWSLHAADKDYVGQTVTWRISDSQIVDFGQSSESEDGVLTQDYIVESVATSDDAPITEGMFRSTVTVYSPKKPKPGQRPGVYYLMAKWEIIDKKILKDKDKLKEKHSQYKMKGFLSANLPFDPTAQAGAFDTKADFPLTLMGKYWGEASGTFHTNELFEGRLEITFDRWQKVKK